MVTEDPGGLAQTRVCPRAARSTVLPDTDGSWPRERERWQLAQQRPSQAGRRPGLPDGFAFCLVITHYSRQCLINRYHGIIRRRLRHQYEIHYCPSSPVANGKNPAAARCARRSLGRSVICLLLQQSHLVMESGMGNDKKSQDVSF